MPPLRKMFTERIFPNRRETHTHARIPRPPGAICKSRISEIRDVETEEKKPSRAHAGFDIPRLLVAVNRLRAV